MTGHHRKAFTLVEVCLAVGVVAVGVLSMCALYTLGFREGQQSEEDVASVSLADEFLAHYAAALSRKTMKWTDWCKIGVPDGLDDSFADAAWPENGWLSYVDVSGDGTCSVKRNCSAIADQVRGQLEKYLDMDDFDKKGKPDLGNFQYAFVVTRRGACIQLAFRAARRAEFLFSQPLTVMEVRYQGDPEKKKEVKK